MTKSTNVNTKFVAFGKFEGKSYKMQFLKDGAFYTMPKADVMKLREDFNNKALNWLVADDALTATFQTVINFAIANALPRRIAGIACAVLLGVDNMTKCIPDNDVASKRIKSRWEVATRTTLPTDKHLIANPNHSYAEIAEAMTNEEKREGIALTGLNNSQSKGEQVAPVLLADLVKSRDYAELTAQIMDNLVAPDKLVFLNAILNGLQLDREQCEHVAQAIAPQLHEIRAPQQAKAPTPRKPRKVTPPKKQIDLV